MARTHDTGSGRPPAPFGTDVLTLDGCWDFFVGDGDLAGMADHEPAAITVPERQYLEHLEAESARWAGTGRPCWSPSSATGGLPDLPAREASPFWHQGDIIARDLSGTPWPGTPPSSRCWPPGRSARA